MWITKRRWDKLQAQIDKIVSSIGVLNEEYGAIQRDVSWLKWLVGLVVVGIIGIAWTVIQKGL